ncbi:MAG: hypothetical protein C4562_00540 [Actinobacteria bacterium]|nr:MAG: hypothetical protein C4562_00540 [Actinomycetota bacterium]
MVNNQTAMQKAMKEAGIKPPAYREGMANNKKLPRNRGALQNRIFENLINDNKLTQIGLIDGSSLIGIIAAYDEYCILIQSESGSDSELVFKHSIRSVKPV